MNTLANILRKLIFILIIFELLIPEINFFGVIKVYPFSIGESLFYICCSLLIVICILFVIIEKICIKFDNFDFAAFTICIYYFLHCSNGLRISNLVPLIILLQYFFLKQCKVNLNLILKVLLLSVCLVSLVSIIDFCKSPRHTDVLTVFASTTLLGNYLIIIIPLTFDNRCFKCRIDLLLVQLIIIAGIFVSQDKSSIVIMVIECFIFLLYPLIKRETAVTYRNLYRGLAFALCILFIVILIFSNPQKLRALEGRYYIHQVSLQFIHSKNCLFGIGFGGFKRKYNLLQATTFKQKDYLKSNFSRQDLLAGNVFWAFDEYLQALIEGGVIGITVLIITLWCAFYSFKHKTVILLTILNFSILAFNDYPFHISYNYILLTYVFLIVQGDSPKNYILDGRIFIILLFLAISSSILCFYSSTLNLLDFNYWVKFREENGAQAKMKMLDETPNGLYENGQFLYEASFNCLIANEPIRAINLLKKGINIYPHSDLFLLLGDAYASRLNFVESEKYYMLSSNITPIHLFPRYKLLNLYILLGDTVKAKRQAKIILKAPVKVWSYDWQTIKNDAQNYLKEH